MEINGHNLEVKVTVREDADRIRRGTGYSRIYIWMPAPEALGQVERHPEYTKRGEDKQVDKAWRAYNKVEKQNMRDVILATFPGLDDPRVQMTHSRNAGCSCGCSPGWIIKGFNRDFRWFQDAYLQVTEVVTPEAAALNSFLEDAKANGAMV